ncbi:hypothetical protein NONO_c49890 [Nocardia nova SH22a]|uniref:DUF8175 domain-containing protein n=1 Tax=Nocardia nova SH22a TaxID=1415166 RepID=W5TLD1_9NOCA|nr:hypothetical protein [Nocardia nova]AHH19773.1 hypothetical protein NONO_c49890 [Nocardia nova SH22a]
MIPVPRLRSVWAATALCACLVLPACAANTAGAVHDPGSRTVSLDPPRPGDTIPVALAMTPWLTWKPWHGTRLPYSQRWGPASVTDDTATGFGHNPEGAVLAMIQQRARLTGIGDAAWLDAARTMAVVAPDDRPPTARMATGIDPAAALPYFSGFRWISYDGTRAVADLALQESDGTLRSLHATEVWHDSDWRAELVPAPTAAPLPGLDDYQPWPGQPRP